MTKSIDEMRLKSISVPIYSPVQSRHDDMRKIAMRDAEVAEKNRHPGGHE